MAGDLGNLMDLALRVCQAQTARLDAALKRLLDHPDEEAVHDVRVACRRLRVALKIAGPFFNKEALVTVRGRLKDLLGRLGQARDAEVLAARARTLFCPQTTMGSRAANGKAARATPLLGVLQEEADRQRRATVEAIQRMGLTSLPQMIAALTAGSLADPEDARIPSSSRGLVVTPLARHARRVLSGHTKKLARFAALDGQSSAGELHALRIAMKKTRYAAEFFATGKWGQTANSPTAGNWCQSPFSAGAPRRRSHAASVAASLNAIVKTAKSYQEALGELHDAVVAQEALAGWLAAGMPALPPEERENAALHAALSSLLASARADEARLRAAFARRWTPRERARLTI